MDVLTAIKTIQDSAEYTNASLDKKIMVNHQLKELMASTPEYGYFKFEQQDAIDKLILSRMPGYDPASVQGDDPVANRSRELLNQAESFKTGQAEINAVDGIMESGRDFLSGKIIAGFSDIFIEGDATEAIYGDINQELERYRDYVAEIQNPEGMADYKVGKVVGNILGFGMDAAGMAALYGSVGAPGLIGKVLGQSSGKVFTAAMAKGGIPKLMAYAPIIGRQAVTETLGYVVEEAVADMIVGEIDKDTTLEEYLRNVPSDLGKGFMYFAFGETLGAGAQKALKGLARVATFKGGRDITRTAALAKSFEESTDMFHLVLANEGASAAKINAMRGGMWDEAAIKEVQQNVLDAKLMLDPVTLAKEPNKAAEVAYRLLYKMDTEVKGNVVKIKSFDNKVLDNPVTVQNTKELSDFYMDNMKAIQNRNFEISKKLASDNTGDIKLSFQRATGEKAVKDISETMSLFEVGAGAHAGTDAYEALAKSLLGEKFPLKVQVVDTVAKGGIQMKENTLIIPKTLKQPYQSRDFAKKFFGQIEYLSAGRIRFNTEALEAMMRTGSNVKYDESFLKKIAPRDAKVKINPQGHVEVKIGADTMNFQTVQLAAGQLHSMEFDYKEIQNVLSRKKGASLKIVGDKFVVSKGKRVVDTFNTMGELFTDPKYRLGLPYEQRTPFLWINPKDGADQPLSSGTLAEAITKARDFEESVKGTFEVIKKGNKTITSAPEFDSFKVTLGDTGMSRQFDNMKDAQDWMAKDLDKYEVLRDEIYSKGWRLKFNQAGGYKIVSPSKEIKYARNLKDVQREISNLENVFNVPELLDQTEMALFKQAIPVIEQANLLQSKLQKKLSKRQVKYKGYKSSRIVQEARKWLVPMRDRIEATGELVPTQLFGKAMVSEKIFQAEYAKGSKWLESVLHGKGRKFNLTELTNMGDVLIEEADPGAWPAIAKKLNLDLTDKHFQAMKTLRDGMDILGKKFGISDREWISNFWTRLSDMKKSKFTELLSTPRSSLTNPWFKRVRSEDYVTAQFKNNIETVFELYMRTGYRELYLGRTIDEINGVIAKASKAVEGDADYMSEEALKLIEDTNEKLLGNIFSSDTARDASDRILAGKARAEAMLAGEGKFEAWSPEKRARKAEIERHKDWTRYSNDLSTAALLSFKMKLPLRNVSQVNSILASLAGAGNVTSAMKQLGDTNFMAATYKDLYEKGIIKPRSGFSYNHGAIMDRVKNWNQIGLNTFFNSDDWTRMVASLSASDVFRNGRALLEEGKIDLAEFTKMCQVNYLGEADAMVFTDLIGKGHLESAETLMQRRWTEMTMFEYEQMNKPEKLNSGLGKLLGQFSTYPLSYVQFVKRGLKAEGAWFATKLMMGSASTAYFYNDIVGVDNAVNLNPLENMLFTGGPVISLGAQTMVNVKNLTFNPSVGGVTHMGKDIAGTFLPFSGILGSLEQGIEAINEGDYHAGLINLMGGKPREEALIRQF